jgi:hypothetical protein
MADTKSTKDAEAESVAGDTVSRGDHGYDDLKGSYSDVKDVEPGQVLSEQEVPAGWPGGPHADAPKTKDK